MTKLMYSQNNEQQVILDYFKDTKGSFLDIGAYDGVDLSNTRALSELGWSGVCVEPNPTVFEKLAYNYLGNKNVHCYELAVGTIDGEFEMMCNDTYYSTLSETETKRWESNPSIQFVKELVEVVTFETFLKNSKIKTFDFISLDAEGVDLDILKQIDLTKVGCKMICVEWNGKDFLEYNNYITKFGLQLISQNAENLIYAI